jgi:ABC-2 type transport system permease protein
VVAHLLRLKLTLLRNGLRRSAWQIVGLAVGMLYGLLALGLVVGSMAVLSVQEPDVRGLVTVLLGSVVVVGWWVVPLVAFGLDATIDPARFVTFAIPRRSLLTGLALAGLLGIPGVVTTVSVLAMAGVWWRTPTALLAGLVCSVLALATCVVGARATTSAASTLLSGRRFREVMAAVAIVPLVLVGPLLGTFFSATTITQEMLQGAADTLGWTPVGAAWAVPAAVADGQWGLAGARFAIAVATLALLAVAWDRALAHALVNPPHQSVSARGRGLGWFGRLPATPLGAVTARCLTYWARDPRYALAVAIVPVLAIVFYVVAPNGQVVLLIGPIAGYLMGWGISADVAYDGTAFWTHVAAPLRGVTDRLGRVLAAGSIAAVAVVVLSVGSALVTGRAALIPALLGVSFGVLLTALAGSSIVSALVVYPVQMPGENPFQSRQGASMSAVASQLGGWLAVMVLSLPEILLAVLAVGQGSAALGWVTLAVGLLLGGVLLTIGVRVGGRTLDRTGPDLLRRIVAFA